MQKIYRFINEISYLLPILIGVIGALTGLVSTYLSYKKQTELYRDKLYKKQIDGYMNICQAVGDLYLVYRSIIVFKMNETEFEGKKVLLNEKYDDLIKKYHTWSIVLSKEFNESFLEFHSKFTNLYEYVENNQNEILKLTSKKVYTDYYKSYNKIYESARKSLNTEQLNEKSHIIIKDNLLKSFNKK